MVMHRHVGDGSDITTITLARAVSPPLPQTIIIRSPAGKATYSAALDALFRTHNAVRERGDSGYRPGEKIAIKVNLITSLDWNHPKWSWRPCISAGAVGKHYYTQPRSLHASATRATATR